MWSISNNGSKAEGTEEKSACSPTRNNRNRFSPSAFSHPSTETRRAEEEPCISTCPYVSYFSPDFQVRVFVVFICRASQKCVSEILTISSSFVSENLQSVALDSCEVRSKASSDWKRLIRKYLTKLTNFYFYCTVMLYYYIFIFV